MPIRPMQLFEKGNKTIRCYKCGRSFPVELYNAGWSGSWILNCDSCPAVLHLSLYDPICTYAEIVYPRDRELRMKCISDEAKNCNCGGKFVFSDYYHCPLCNELLDFHKIEELKIPNGWYANIIITELYEGFEMWKRSVAELIKEKSELDIDDGLNKIRRELMQYLIIIEKDRKELTVGKLMKNPKAGIHPEYAELFRKLHFHGRKKNNNNEC